jgi:hypothetical protein
MYVVYQHMRLVMKLSDADIVRTVSSVLKDPSSGVKPTAKRFGLAQIQDQKKNTTLSSLVASNDPAAAAKLGQTLAEKLITAGAMTTLEKHWEKQAGVRPVDQDGQRAATTAATTAATPRAAQPKAATTAAVIPDKDIDAALKALESLP